MKDVITSLNLDVSLISEVLKVVSYFTLSLRYSIKNCLKNIIFFEVLVTVHRDKFL